MYMQETPENILNMQMEMNIETFLPLWAQLVFIFTISVNLTALKIGMNT